MQGNRETSKNLLSPEEVCKIYFLPNLFTAGNLFFGFLSIIRCIQAKYTAVNITASQAYYRHAIWFIFFAFVCDALDGRIARLGGKVSFFGTEFDSIADTVSFGVAPALMVFFLILSPSEGYPFFQQIGWIISFIYLLCASVRLARFNTIASPLLSEYDPQAKKGDFKGLPVPAAAAVIASLVLTLNSYELNAWSLVLPFLMLFIAWLMISSIPYPSFSDIDWQTRTPLINFVILFIVGIIIFTFSDIFFVIVSLLYIFYGPFAIFKNKLSKHKLSFKKGK